MGGRTPLSNTRKHEASSAEWWQEDKTEREGGGQSGRVGAPWAGPLLLSAGAGHRGSGRLNHSGRRWVGGVPGPQQLCPGSGVEGAGPGVLATGPSWGPPEAEGLTLVGRRDLPLDRRSHHCCHLGSRDSRSLSQVGETFCSGDCRNVCQPHSRCLLCLWREPWGAGSRLVGGTLGQPWGEMLPGGRFLSPLPRDCEHVPSDRTPLAVPGRKAGHRDADGAKTKRLSLLESSSVSLVYAGVKFP